MVKLLFLLHMGLWEMAKNKRLNIIVIISLSIGLFMPFFSIASINHFLKNLNSLKPIVLEDAYQLSVFSEHLSESDYLKLKKDMRTENVAGSERVNAVVEINGYKIADTVMGVQSDYREFIHINLIEGQWFKQEELITNARVCIIEKNLLDSNEITAKLGDPIELNGYTFKIIGICDTFDSTGQIYVPCDSIPIFSLVKEKHQYNLYLQYGEDSSLDIVQRKADAIFTQILYLTTIQESYKNKVLFGIQNSIVLFCVTIPILIFSCLNSILVISGKVESMQYNLKLKMIMGADSRDFFLSCFCENFLLMMAGYILDILFMPIVRHLLPEEFILEFDLAVYIIVFVVMLFICVLLSLAAIKKTKNLLPSDML